MASAFQSEMREYQKYVNGVKKFYSFNGCGIEKEDLLAEITAINDQIKNEGIKIQSAIITAPTKNILKFKEKTNVAYIDLVGVGFDSYIGEE
ncbi:MAG TPA: hypothetical protein PK604_12590 [Acetivibrio clariflavus]|nr:hypothetical protein [Acetivibrio clariflavus]